MGKDEEEREKLQHAQDRFDECVAKQREEHMLHKQYGVNKKEHALLRGNAWEAFRGSQHLDLDRYGEFYGGVEFARRGLGLRSLITDLGAGMNVRMSFDPTGAKGIASKRGAGGVRHIETRTLWLQNAVGES